VLRASTWAARGRLSLSRRPPSRAQVRRVGPQGRDLSGEEMEAMSEEQRAQLIKVAEKL